MCPRPCRAVRAATLIKSRRRVAPRAFAQAGLAREPAARSRLQLIAAQADGRGVAVESADTADDEPDRVKRPVRLDLQPSHLQKCRIRGPTQPIALYRPIRHSAELSI